MALGNLQQGEGARSVAQERVAKSKLTFASVGGPAAAGLQIAYHQAHE